MKIRAIEFQDLDGVLSIYTPIVEETHISFEYQPPGKEEFWLRVERIRATHPWLVLEDGNRIIGYAYATQVRGREAYSWSAELSVYISNDQHGKGLGRLLYLALIKVLEAQGIQNFYGVISLPNKGSELFHEKLGFQKIAVFDKIGYKNEQWRGIAWYYLRKGGDDKPKDFLPFKTFTSNPVYQKTLEEINQDLLKKTTV